jgi:hypothetical protein
MEEAHENGKESLHSAHANGMNECTRTCMKHVLKITNKQTKQTTKQPGRPKDQAISLLLLNVEARVLFQSIFFHCSGDGDCMCYRPHSTNNRKPPQE